MTTPTTKALVPPRPTTRRPGPITLIRTGLSEMFGRRRLIRYLIGSDIKQAHADTLFGQLWWIIDPLMQMAIYIVLVTIIFQRKIPDYPLFIFAAILPWKWFTNMLNDSTLSVTTRQGLIRQIQFPKIVLPTASILAATWSFVFGLIALGLVYLFFRDRLSVWVLTLPIIASVQFLFALALGIMFSALNVFFRDIQNVLRHALRLWFYLSPALYSLDVLAKPHPTLYRILQLNPFTVLFDSYRNVTWGTSPPEWTGLAILAVVSFFLLLVAILVFKRAEPAFARIL
jgi:ABC-type polysaccharide/polyol phosphate export permease